MANITPSQRLAALHSAKTLLAGEQGNTLLGKNNVAGPKPLPMIRLAEYIVSGNDYRDVAEVKPANHVTPDDEQVKSPIIMTHEEWESSGGEAGPHGGRGVLVLPPELVIPAEADGDSPADQDGAL